jgi:hypothetical protein
MVDFKSQIPSFILYSMNNLHFYFENPVTTSHRQLCLLRQIKREIKRRRKHLMRITRDHFSQIKVVVKTFS